MIMIMKDFYKAQLPGQNGLKTVYSSLSLTQTNRHTDTDTDTHTHTHTHTREG